MLTTVIVVLLVIVFGVVTVAAMKPDEFSVDRRATIRADAPKIFALLEDFRQWQAWSPWEGLDPALERSYSGPASGVGAAYAWRGNKQVGEGRMEIRETVPPSKLVITLDFLKPFEAHNTAQFVLAPASGGGTDVTWSMFGRQPFLLKLMAVFMPMDKMVGKDFEKGLDKLKKAVEV